MNCETRRWFCFRAVWVLPLGTGAHLNGSQKKTRTRFHPIYSLKFGVSFVSHGDLTETCGAIFGFAKCWHHRETEGMGYARFAKVERHELLVLISPRSDNTYHMVLDLEGVVTRTMKNNDAAEKENGLHAGQNHVGSISNALALFRQSSCKNWCYKHDFAKDSSQLPRFPCLLS